MRKRRERERMLHDGGKSLSPLLLVFCLDHAKNCCPFNDLVLLRGFRSRKA